MHIGLIIHSQTGNTCSVAERLQERLVGAGHSVKLERVEAVGEAPPRTRDVKLRSSPDPSPYDAVVFGAPVHAFSLSPVMQAYLHQTTSLQEKRAVCLVTQHFPFAWMGGRRAVRQMSAVCRAKGAEVRGSGIVNWSRRRREQQIVEVVERLGRCFPAQGETMKAGGA